LLAGMYRLAFSIYPPFRQMRGLVPLGVASVLVMWLSFVISRVRRAKQRATQRTATQAESAS
jgi:hypothetical protein